MLAATLASALATAAAADDDVVELELRASAARVVLHQQVVLELRVRHALHARPRWEAPPFDGFWSERLPGEGGPLERESDGRALRTTRLRRALFPTREGPLEIPASRLWARDRDGRERAVPVPPTQIRVDPLPAAGRPPAFAGLVGRPELKLELGAREVAVGRSVSLVIDVHGRANVWDAALPPLESLLDSGLEVFRERPRLVTAENAGTLSARRTFRFELVPTRAGRFEVPALALPYYDPAGGAYRIARTEPTAFDAVARPRPAAPPWSARPRSAEPLPTGVLLLATLGALAALGAGGYAVTVWWRRSLRAWLRPPAPRPRAVFDRAQAATGTERTRLLRAALEAAVHLRHGLDATALTPDEIATRIDDPDAVSLLRALESLRFGGDGAATPDEAFLLRIHRYLQA